jgi:hypothetical protein
LTLSAKPKAWNISMVRVLMPSALPLMMLRGHALDDHRLDLGELRQLRGQAQAGRPGAGDQHIHLLGQRLVDAPVAPVGRGFLHVRVAAAEAILVELHLRSPGFAAVLEQVAQLTALLAAEACVAHLLPYLSW